jgi:hypothetical protein
MAWVEFWQIHKYAFAASVLNEFNTFDKEDCGSAIVCDIDNLNLDFDLETNMWLLFAVAMGWNILGALLTIRFGYRIRT